MYCDLTKGNILKGLIIFALPMMAGNLLQQMYNIADTIIVGQVVGRNALAVFLDLLWVQEQCFQFTSAKRISAYSEVRQLIHLY